MLSVCQQSAYSVPIPIPNGFLLSSCLLGIRRLLAERGMSGNVCARFACVAKATL